MSLPPILRRPGPDRGTQAGERRLIARLARALASRAEQAGLPLAAFLLGIAATEANADSDWRGSAGQAGRRH